MKNKFHNCGSLVRRRLGLRSILLFFILHSSFFISAQDLHTKTQKTIPETVEDLDTTGIAIKRPDNIKQVTELDSLSGNYRIGTKLGTGGFLNTPILMTPDEYQKWSLQQSMNAYYRQKNREEYESQGKSKFDFTDMKFDLGPAENIFGPGGVQTVACRSRRKDQQN